MSAVDQAQYTQNVLDALFGGRGDALSAQAQQRYEARLVDEAERIVAGESDEEPSIEHLRVLLSRQDPGIRDEDVPL